ncbi:MAG: GNAT family N-acetyltransferase [Clostridiales bacterium]|nr:GNAT family N-acetyltransferase [Clostridiales bacterium]
MEITTERLTLKPLNTSYLFSTHRYASDAENTQYMTCLPADTIEETRAFLRKCQQEWEKTTPGFYELAVLKDGIHIGAVSIYLNPQRDTANLGWILAGEYHGHGYATEAAAALVDFAKHSLDIRRFTAHCDSANTASENVMHKLGMKKTAEYGGRKNRISLEERIEFEYVLVL